MALPFPQPPSLSPRRTIGLRVLIVTNIYPHEANPAYGTFVMQQVDGLRRAGHHVDVLHIEGYKSKTRYLTGGWRVFASTRRTRYDIVHAHYGLTGFPALWRWNTPLVITLHGTDALCGILRPLVSRTVCRLADAVIVVSREIGAKIPGDLIPCGIDLDLFRPGDRVLARTKLGLPIDRRLVVFPFDPNRRLKRYELALAAIRRVGATDVECLVVSHVPYEQMPWYYRAADAMLLCSESEGSPTSVKEALACNIPVVSTDVGDVAEIVKGIDGCEICEARPESLADGLRRVLQRSGVAFHGRDAMSRYDQDRTAEAVVKVYERMLARRGRVHNGRRRPREDDLGRAADRPPAVTQR